MLLRLKNKNMKEYIKNKLLELGFIDIDFYNDISSIRIDEMDKDYLIELYQLRVKINTEKSNQEGIEFSNEYLRKLSECDGDKLLSILLKTNNNISKSFFSDREMSFFW